MGCFKLTYHPEFLQLCKEVALEKSDHETALPQGEKYAGEKKCIDYYPFGLTFNSYQRENGLLNRYLYNQGAGDKRFLTERVFDLGLNVDLTKFRVYDPAMGRWWQIDPKADSLGNQTPYSFAHNNPVLHNDPNGDLPILLVTAGVGALIGGVAGAIVEASNGGSWGDVGKAAAAGAVGGAIIGSGAGLIAGSAVAASTAGVVAASAATGMVAGAAEATTRQVLDNKGINTANIVKAAAVGGASNAIAGPAGKFVVGQISKALTPAVNSLGKAVAGSSSPLVVAGAQTAANPVVKALGNATVNVAKDASQKVVENKAQEKLQKN